MSGTVKFRKKNQSLQEEAVKVLARERPMTLRALYYQLASAGQIPAEHAGYRRLQKVMTRLRESGAVPVTGWLVDRVRSTLKPSSWSGLADYGDAIRECYRKDLWPHMPEHIEVFVEKDAIAGTVQPVTEEYDVALNVIRGDVSISFAGEVAELWKLISKPICVYYFGDFDPSGFGIELELRKKLEEYSGRTVRWQRLGVIADDFKDFELLRLPVKDSARSAGFVKHHGKACAEVDALPPTELRRRLRDAIESHIDQDRWTRLKRTEELEQQTLMNLIGMWPKADLGPVSSSGAKGGGQ